MNYLHASISLGFVGYILATFGTKVSFKSILWSNGRQGGSSPSLGSSKTLAYLAYCGGSFCSTFSVACAKAIERESFRIWGWSPPSTCQRVAAFCC